MLAERLRVPPHELLGLDEVPAWMAADAALVLEAEAEHLEREWRRSQSSGS